MSEFSWSFSDSAGGNGDKPVRLVVFSDDWGRHPSSCQHLIGQMLDRYRVTWVNTIGTRWPGLNVEDMKKVGVKLQQWACGVKHGGGEKKHSNLEIVSPMMWPGFRKKWQRGLNARVMARQVNRALGERDDEYRIGITTVPIAADVVGRVDVDRWVYYCVDDFSVWPGLDGDVMDLMERELVAKVEEVVVVSKALEQRIESMGRNSVMLTHGIDMDHWAAGGEEAALPQWFKNLDGPVYLYWGLVDKRLDSEWCLALAELGGTLVLAGPQQDIDARLSAAGHIVLPGKVDYRLLPTLAQAADVLVMPYADLPVTRAMQPLKFKEYLATGKAVVVSNLPALQGWESCAAVVDYAGAFVSAARSGVEQGASETQMAARKRLLGCESWKCKSEVFEGVLMRGVVGHRLAA